MEISTFANINYFTGIQNEIDGDDSLWRRIRNDDRKITEKIPKVSLHEALRFRNIKSAKFRIAL